jgi:hypothetical protein
VSACFRINHRENVFIQQSEDVEANQAEAEAKAKKKQNLVVGTVYVDKSVLFFLASAFTFALIGYTAASPLSSYYTEWRSSWRPNLIRRPLTPRPIYRV